MIFNCLERMFYFLFKMLEHKEYTSTTITGSFIRFRLSDQYLFLFRSTTHLTIHYRSAARVASLHYRSRHAGVSQCATTTNFRVHRDHRSTSAPILACRTYPNSPPPPVPHQCAPTHDTPSTPPPPLYPNSRAGQR